VKDVVEQQARSRGGLIDQALVQRRRKDALSRLGESVYRLSQRGELGELALDPEIGMAIAEIDGLDNEYGDDYDHDESAARRSGAEAVSSADYRPVKTAPSEGEYRVWRPVMPDDEPAETDDLEADTLQDVEAPVAESKPKSPARMARKSARRSGGAIRFVEEEPRPGDVDCDDDLEGYMHDDDVPE
jgi:hypothetical protein